MTDFSLALNTDPGNATISISGFDFTNSDYNTETDTLTYVCTNPTNSTILNDEFSKYLNIMLTNIENIPSGVTSIDSNAFTNCFSLETVTFGSNSTLASIGDNAFKSCIALNSIAIPSSVNSIGKNIFQNCYSLNSITIPNNVTSIGEFSFQNCYSLINIAYPNTVTNIGQYAFDNISSSAIITITAPTTNPCFKEGSLILTIDGYVPIENLHKGDLVKTLTKGYLSIEIIGKKTITNSKNDIPGNKLYICTNENYPEVFEDLYMTGFHSILVDSFISMEQKQKTINTNGDAYVTERKYRLPVCVDNRAIPYETEGQQTIYHLALENDDYYMNYGIYANGLLVESSSKRYLKELSKMTLIE